MSMQRPSSLSELRRGALSSRKFTNFITPPRLSSLTRIILTLTSICGVTILTTFLNGALTVALPSIARSVNLSQENLSWPLSNFSLVSGALLLISGGMADAFGRRPIFLLGIVVFGIVSLATSFVKTGGALIGCCAALGLAAAMLIPAGVGILGSSIPEGKIKNQAFAAIGASQPIGFILGLVLGGLLANKWQAIFWILTAFAFVFGICAWVSLPNEGEELIRTANNSQATSMINLTDRAAPLGSESRRMSSSSTTQKLDKGASTPRAELPTLHTNADGEILSSRTLRLKTFDWFGSCMSTSGLVMVTFALADAESAPKGWRTSYVIALIPLGIAMLTAFFVWERYLERLQRTYELGASNVATTHRRNATFFKAPPTTPLLPPAIWRAPRFGTVLLVVFLAWMSFNVTSYLSTLVFQEVQGISPTRTSLYFLPMIVVGLLLNVLAGQVVGKVAAVWLIVSGAVAGAAACVILSVGVTPSTPYYKAMLWTMILQVGPDVFFSAASLYLSKSVGRQQQALAGSLFNTTIRLATSLGLAITSTISTSVAKKHVAKTGARLVTRDLSMHPSMLLSTHPLLRRAAAAASDDGTVRLPAQALLEGYKAASWFCFACSMLSIVIALARLRTIGIVGGMEGKVEDSTRPPSPSLPSQGDQIELETIVAGSAPTNTSAHVRR